MRRRRSNALPPHLIPANRHVPAGPLVFGGSDQRYEGSCEVLAALWRSGDRDRRSVSALGSYFAVLANHDLPQWTAAFDPEVSCIGDGEMARINIEASAALSDWIDLMQADQQRFRKLVKAAVQLLPFPIAQLDGSTYYNRFRALGAINSTTGRRYLMEAFARDFGSEWLEREKARVLVHPTRALANGVLNEHWRNGSGIEDIHAGGIAPPRPLTQCRLTKAQEVCADPARPLSCRQQTERGNLAGTGAPVRDCLQASGGLVTG